MTASIILIISAAFHALWNLALKRSQHRIGSALAFMLLATILNALCGMASSSMPAMSPNLILSTVAAGVFEGVYFYLLNTAYSKQTLGVSYTIMRGGAMVLVWAISSLALGESATELDIASILAILAGLMLVQRSYSMRELLASGMYAAYLCAGCIAGYHIAYGIAVRTGAAPPLVFAAAMTCGALTYLVCSRGDALKDLIIALRHEARLITLGGLACGLSFLLFLTALVIVEPGRAISLRNSSVAFGALLSFLVGERLLPIQWIGVLFVVIGALGLI
jgi:drug/metabolite transporter (DMT)-like permease